MTKGAVVYELKKKRALKPARAVLSPLWDSDSISNEAAAYSMFLRKRIGGAVIQKLIFRRD